MVESVQIYNGNEGYGMVQLLEKEDNVKNSPCDLAVALGKLNNGGVWKSRVVGRQRKRGGREPAANKPTTSLSIRSQHSQSTTTASQQQR